MRRWLPVLLLIASCGSKPQTVEVTPPAVPPPVDAAAAPQSQGPDLPSQPDVAPPAFPVASDPALAKRLDAAIDKAIAEQQQVGVVVLVARDGKLVYSRAVGHADRESKVSTKEDTMFRFASMTKPIVSVAALALVDQGKLGLDDPITKYLPDFKPKLANGRDAVITVRQLLTHTSGLSYRFTEPANSAYHKAEISDGLAEPGLGAPVNLRRLAAVPLLAEPGRAWRYSLSTDVLGEVVARAAGGDMPAVVKDLVLRPLKMVDTAFAVTDRARLAWPYAAGKPPARMTEPHTVTMGPMSVKFSPARVFDSASFPSGGAGLAGTAVDYLRFCEALRTGAILKPDTLRAMTENQIGNLATYLGNGVRFGYGVGVVVDPAAAKTKRGRGAYGWGGIYGTNFWVDPVAKLSVVVLTNVAGDVPFSDDIENAIYP